MLFPKKGQYVRTPEMRKEASERAKGNIYAKGRICTPETREKIRQSNLGQKRPFKPRPKALGRKVWNKGVPMREETKKKQSLLRKGTKAPWMLGNTFGKASKGHYPPRNGENSPHWIEDRTKIVGRHNRSFHDSEMKQWRMNVYKRDNFKCKISNDDCNGKIEAHHILTWKDHPELRYEINNGITLCHFHHPRKREDEKRLSPYFQNLILRTEQ
jgi:hypothetical protein